MTGEDEIFLGEAAKLYLCMILKTITESVRASWLTATLL